MLRKHNKTLEVKSLNVASQQTYQGLFTYQQEM